MNPTKPTSSQTREPREPRKAHEPRKSCKPAKLRDKRNKRLVRDSRTPQTCEPRKSAKPYKLQLAAAELRQNLGSGGARRAAAPFRALFLALLLLGGHGGGNLFAHQPLRRALGKGDHGIDGVRAAVQVIHQRFRGGLNGGIVGAFDGLFPRGSGVLGLCLLESAVASTSARSAT